MLIKNIVIKLILTILISSTSFTGLTRNLNVGWELWFPYQYRNKSQELIGLDIEIFKAVITKAGLTANYVELPWKRHLRYIESGDIDLAFGASYTLEREKYAYFSLPYRLEIVKLFIRKGDKPKLNKLSDIVENDFLLGIETGYYYGDAFKKLMQSPEFKQHTNEVLDVEQNISMLLKGRINGLLADPNTIAAFCEKYKISGTLELYPLDIYQANIYMMLSRKTLNTDILAKINNSIKSLKKDGTLTAISKKWNILAFK